MGQKITITLPGVDKSHVQVIEDIAAALVLGASLDSARYYKMLQECLAVFKRDTYLNDRICNRLTLINCLD